MGIFGITSRNFTSGNLTQFDNYLADFPQFEAIEVASCKGGIREEEIWETGGINGLPFEVYLKLLPMFAPLAGTALQSLDSPLFSS